MSVKFFYALGVLFSVMPAIARADCEVTVRGINLPKDMVSIVTIGANMVTLDSSHPTAKVHVIQGNYRVRVPQIGTYRAVLSLNDFHCGSSLTGPLEEVSIAVTYVK